MVCRVRLRRELRNVEFDAEVLRVEGAKRTVFVVGPGNKLERREVTLGIVNAEVVEIASGLTETSLVVSDAAANGLSGGLVVEPRMTR